MFKAGAFNISFVEQCNDLEGNFRIINKKTMAF